MSFPTWLAFAGASIVLLLIPGPTILLVIGDSLANHQRSSWSTVAGVAAGDTTAMSLSLAGAGALLAASAAAFALLKLAGGAYLIYLGLRALLRAHRQGAAPLSLQARPARNRFVSAWAVTALNPKSLVFFIAFVPQFISPQAGYVAQCAILLPTFVLLATINAAGYAHIGRYAAQRLTSATAQRRLGYGGGLALLGAGVLTLGMSRR
ncbi:MAG: LysE family translocator [Betaproteobacteria bacterium]|nr:LysE family translocator [Betaproteobacteria bacterium]MBU6511790.1 LysE family translocator [Betaproteobacteria bacterium]MDE1955063.1 LysE family translocator [Betaproteobacteria bacterium]MDE2152098.1 LysE family translocator [Betaproteobacteria bacterium]MDE2479708.1 LysE family translocator [Betaproteobacteria bacterium]